MAKQSPPQRKKHIPQRTCVVCRTRDNKRQLVRLVRTEDGVQVDPSGKMNGRGAYLCDDPRCWDRAVSTLILNKALKTVLTDDDKSQLQQVMPSHE